MTDRSKLQRLLDTPLQQFPEKTAIHTESQQVTYRELDRLARSVAAGLLNHGVGSGDRVAWFLPNCLEAVVTTLACYQIGAVAVPLNYRYVADEAQDVLQRTAAKILIFHAARSNVVAPLLSSGQPTAFEIGGPALDGADPFDKLLGHQPLDEPILVEGTHPALILFTSGSTGRPKGVVHSHDGAHEGIDVSRRVFDFTKDDVVLVGKPISHAGGLQTQLMPTLKVGGQVVLAMKPEPAKAVAFIRTHSVTEYGLLSSDLLDFIEHLEGHPTLLPSLSNSIGSGDAVPSDLHSRFRDLFGWEVMEGAGMTEIGGYYAVNPRYGKRKWGSLGLPTPDTQLRIVDHQGTDCRTGHVGEIIIRTLSTTTGYWEDEGASEGLFRGGWLHTGDLARRDADGYIWFVGRQKLMIVRRGSNIAPAEVEDVIDQHPQVHASVVVGLHDHNDGQVPVACVALKDGCDRDIEDQLRRFVAAHLAEYKNPTRYLILDKLPRTGTGKFDRHRIQELAEQAFAT